MPTLVLSSGMHTIPAVAGSLPVALSLLEAIISSTGQFVVALSRRVISNFFSGRPIFTRTILLLRETLPLLAVKVSSLQITCKVLQGRKGGDGDGGVNSLDCEQTSITLRKKSWNHVRAWSRVERGEWVSSLNCNEPRECQ